MNRIWSAYTIFHINVKIRSSISLFIYFSTYTMFQSHYSLFYVAEIVLPFRQYTEHGFISLEETRFSSSSPAIVPKLRNRFLSSDSKFLFKLTVWCRISHLVNWRLDQLTIITWKFELFFIPLIHHDSKYCSKESLPLYEPFCGVQTKKDT